MINQNHYIKLQIKENVLILEKGIYKTTTSDM